MNQLKFNADGNFKIMQISDIQDSCDVSSHTIDLISAALDREKPDLVVFSGDMVKGYSLKFIGGKAEGAIKKTISQFLEPVISRKIPFTVAFGNHDLQAPLPLQKQLAFYQESEYCCAYDTPGVEGCGNHNIPIYSSDGKNILFNLYVIDSHGSAKVTGYTALDPNQIKWYQDKRDELKEQNSGKFVPSVIFQHIPVEQVFQLYSEVPKKTKNAVPGYRKYKNKFYILNDKLVNKDAFFGESPAIPDEDAGLFDAAAENGDVKGIYFGHDHKNGFSGKVGNIELGYCPGCGYTTYGPGKNRGFRIFEFKADDPENYKTRLVTHRDLFGEDSHLSFMTKVTDHTPTSVAAGFSLGIKILAGIVVITAFIIYLRNR
ncbi:MAG: metallophosphoesterase family protein [Clostridiales bacterium]|nr:metallophosphoesterase family protein [Clostridiales bacterium]